MKYKIPLVFILCFSLILCASSQKKLQKQRAKDPRYQYNVGLVYLQNGNLDQAITYFNRSLLLRPNFDLALNALGLAYFMKGQFEKAQEYFLKCLQVNPNFTEARNYLGSVYQEMGLLDKAEEEFRKAAADESYSSRELPYYNLARLYLTLGKDEEALELVEKSIAINNKMVMSLNLRGVLLERLGRIEEAIASYKKALAITPDDVNLSFNLAVAYFKNDQRMEAKALFEKIYAKVTDPKVKSKIDEYLKVLK
ncbi:MAG: tetratricopeptide repeat protein [Candidatus Aminicenantales bacterium]